MARIPEDCRINQTDYDDVALGTTTVGDDGCAACCLAMRLLSLMDTEVDDDLRKDAVEAIASSGFFTSEGWIYNPPQSQSVTVNSESYTIGYQTTSDLAAEILNGKTGYVHFEYGRASHYVFVDNQYKEAIYRVNEEIAYRLHCASNGKYNINSGELTEIITKIAETEPILSNESGRNIVKRSYALCTYWRVNSDDGSIEFYHNKIRDFFLCEKIYREINDIFSCDIKSDEKMLEEAIKRLCALFRHGKINETVWKYIKERTKYKRRKESREKEYPFVVQKNQNFTAVIEKMLTDSGIVFNILKNARNPIRRFCGIFGEIIKSYLFAESELLLLYKGERLKLWNDVERVNGIGLLEDIAKIGVFYNFMLSYTDLNNVVMEGADLRYVNFEGTYLQGSNLREANLCNAHMTWVHLENADLYGAHLNRAYLLVAHLNSVIDTPTN